MFVIENWNDFAIFSKDIGNLLEKLVSRIFRLTKLGFLVSSMLADNQHSIDRDLFSTTPQGFRDSRIKWKSEFCGSLFAKVILWCLINICGNNIDRRLMPMPIDWISYEEPLCHVPSVRIKSPFRRNNGQAFSFSISRRLRI